MLIDQLPEVEVLDQGGRQEEPRVATRRSSSKDVAIRSRLWEDRIRQVLLCSGSMGFSQGHHPRSEGHLFCCPG
jgi:hypothetical protein